MLVAEDLHFEMARALHQLFQIDVAAPERRLGLAPTGLHAVSQILLAADGPHAPPAAAPARLQHQRIADGIGQIGDFLHVSRQNAGGRHHGNASGLGDTARADLVAQPAHGLRRRSDEGDARGRAGFG